LESVQSPLSAMEFADGLNAVYLQKDGKLQPLYTMN
jgi:hypothetical protein